MDHKLRLLKFIITLSGANTRSMVFDKYCEFYNIKGDEVLEIINENLDYLVDKEFLDKYSFHEYVSVDPTIEKLLEEFPNDIFEDIEKLWNDFYFETTIN
jgi:hypothetical protein